jgi:flagellar hook-basal body complex protein FliE
MIEQIAGFQFTEALQQAGKTGDPLARGAEFAQALERAVEATNAEIKTADTMVEALAAGEPVGLHETMIAVERADIAVRTAVAVKSRMIEAYQEIMRMQI